MELLRPSEYLWLRGDGGVAVSGIAYHSARVEPGFLFVALKGQSRDGHDYLPEAVQKGATAVVLEQERPLPSSVTVFRVEDSRAALARVAARFYGHPSRELTVIGITGTNGKTTTSFLLESILKAAGYQVGVIGTINYRYGGKTIKAVTTTPQSLDLQALLEDMRREGMTHVVMEVSSHALEQKRVDEVGFRAAVFTNLSRDHLDYHGDMEEYFKAKSRLFKLVVDRQGQGPAVVVINGDDPYAGRIPPMCEGARCIFYGLGQETQLRATQVRASLDGLEAVISYGSHRFKVRSSLTGAVNIYNILAAAGVGLGLGLEPAVLEKGISHLPPVPGRLFPVKGANGTTVFIDYAHTPDALEKVLQSVTGLTRGRIITVFGCGGDRDRGKRPLMGRVAGELSQMVVLTSDNPRSEDPLAIIKDIEPGLEQAGLKKMELDAALNGRGYVVIPDRRQAIRQAVGMAGPGDVVLIAGKGHETYQIMGDSVRDFDDTVEARKALKQAGK